MSIYTACRQAALEILENPGEVKQDVYGIEGIFTELDVIIRAARELDGAPEEQREAWMRLAQREASQVMGGLFRSREVARFGPVRPPDKDLDYLRASSKIIYTSLDGPEFVETPNGIFIRLFHEMDPIAKRRGRKLGKSRNDLEPWEKQPTIITKEQTAEQREILRLQTELATSYQRLNKTHGELNRLRQHMANLLTREEVEQMISSATQSLENKIRSLENQVA